ncbi:unnamed protein product [Brachionus calyciflorus]|uniref:Uncharacterized protein n=1 Tax=Brachionus calyciflorus TaxID=104777 RepID=A0A813YHG3_9BILA|nr:unnamed protein product [Brachionus calyciflorus]
MIPLNHGSTLRMSTKSPYIARKPPIANHVPRIQPSVIKAAVTGNNQAIRTSQNLAENEGNNNVQNDNNNPSNNASFNLSGDRVVMSNVAGSRRPVAGGYSFF